MMITKGAITLGALLAGLFGSFFAVHTFEPVVQEQTFGAQPAITTAGGGTGTTSPSGILYGDETIRLKTVGIGSGLSFSGGTLSATGGSGASTTLLADSNTFSGNNTFSNTITGAITGNAGSATVLQTSRNINGVAFNGSANITINAASSTLLSDNNTFSNTITGSITGNAGTATALADNGNNCAAGSYPLGVDASGAVEDCTATFAYPFPSNATTTLLSFNGGASTTLLSANYASSTLYYGAGLADCNTGNMLTWTAGRFGCEADDTGAGGGTSDFTFSSHYGEITAATSSAIWAQGNVYASSSIFIGPSGGLLTNSIGDITNAASISLDPVSVSVGADSITFGAANNRVLSLTTTGYTFYNPTDKTALLNFDSLTDARTFTFPDVTGTICLTSTCAAFSYLFPSNATTTLLTFSGGLVSVGSTTINGNATTTGTHYATTASSTNLKTTYASSSVLTSPLAYIAKLSNLTSNGFVKTSGGDGTLSVDTTTYESGLTAGDGLTRTVNDFDCDTASASVFGCLSTTNWSTFNNKISSTSLSATFPLAYNSSTGAFTFGGLSTSSAISAGSGLLYATGVNTVASISTSSALGMSITGNAGTATALAANGANCSAGSFPLGVDASGAIETCTDAWTEAENTAAAYAPQSRQLTVAGTANQITSSAGAQTLAADRTWTLSLPNHVIFPGNFQATNATTTNATSTNQDITSLLTFGGVTGNSWDDFCTTITGGSGLCDGTDATGGGGGEWPFTPSTYAGVANQSTTTNLWLKNVGLIASSTYADNATTTNATSTNLYVSGQTRLASLSGFLKAATGVVSTALIGIADLASTDFGDWTCNGSACTVDADSIALTTDTTGNYVQSIADDGNSTVTVTNGTAEGGAATLRVIDVNCTGCLGATEIAGLGTADISGLDISDDTNLTAGDNLTLTDDDLDLDTTLTGLTSITTTNLIATNGTTTNATSTSLNVSGQVDFDTLTSALVLTGAGGILAEYAGTSCTNQFVRSLSALGAATCASINNGDWSGTDLSVANGGTGLSTFGGTNTVLYTTAADTLASEAAFTYAPSTDLLTVVNASTTNATIASFFKLPTATSFSNNMQGTLAFDSTSGNLLLGTTTSPASNHVVIGSATTTLYSFSVASTSPDFASGGIIDMPSHPLQQVMTAIWCKVDSGTSQQIFFSDGTNDTNTITCTTTGTQFAITTNNTWTAYEAIRLEFATKSGSPDYLTVRAMGYRTSN